MIRTPGSSKYHRLRTIRDMRDLYIYPQYFDAPVILDFRVAEKKNAKTSPGDYDCGQLVLQFVVFRRLLAENRSEVFFRVHSFFLDIRETKYNTWQKTNKTRLFAIYLAYIYMYPYYKQHIYFRVCLKPTLLISSSTRGRFLHPPRRSEPAVVLQMSSPLPAGTCLYFNSRAHHT